MLVGLFYLSQELLSYNGIALRRLYTEPQPAFVGFQRDYTYVAPLSPYKDRLVFFFWIVRAFVPFPMN